MFFHPCIFPFTFSRCVWWAGGASASLFSAEALVVYIQAGRDVHAGFLVGVPADVFFHLHFSRSVWRAGVASTFYYRRRCLWLAYEWDGRADARFWFLRASALVFFISHFSQSVWGAGGEAPLYSRWRRLWYAYKWHGRAGARDFVLCVSALVFVNFRLFRSVWGAEGASACIYLITFLPECVGGRGCKRFSTLGGGASSMHTSGTGGGSCMSFRSCIFSFACLPEFV